MNTVYDLVVVGGGFGGTLLAMIARRLGRSVLVLERGRHPRFAIGESSTPLANLVLEELCRRYDLKGVAPLAKYGTWQAAKPEVTCGLKRGFTFLHHTAGVEWGDDDRHARQMLVAASPRDAIADTHWFRADFDRYLAEQARAMGVEVWEETEAESVRILPESGGVAVGGRRAGQPFQCVARWMVDASGPRGFLFRALGLPATVLEGLPRTQSLFSHFVEVPRWDELFAFGHGLPYPVDDAAVHHVFAGGWVWVLRFNNGVVSAGAAVEEGLAEELRLREGENGWRRMLERFPGLRRQLGGARAIQPMVYQEELAFRCGQVVGPGWVMLPSAAGVVDPLLSTGFTLNLLGLERLARVLERVTVPTVEDLSGYAEDTLAELDGTARLVGALYASMADFETFAAVTKLYFAAVSFAETARRLGQPERGGRRFLLGDHPTLGLRWATLCRQVREHGESRSREVLLRELAEAIGPVDVAGLGRAGAGNWYPARAEDLLGGAGKLGVSESEMRLMMERCGFWKSDRPE